MIVWLNGTLIAQEDAALGVGDRGFTLGDGLFETIKIKRGQPLRLAAHLRRLRSGAAILRLALNETDDFWAEAIAATIAANGQDDGALRLTVSRGPGQRGLLPPQPGHPTLLLTLGALPLVQPPARVVVAESVRRNAHSPLARCKSLSYLDNILARLEAEERGADDALLLNTEGRVAESSIANLFVVGTDGILVTPPVSDGALAGVRRDDLLRAMVAIERPLRLIDVLAAREAFLSNALSIRPLIAVNGTPIGDGQPGPLSRRLQEEVLHE